MPAQLSLRLSLKLLLCFCVLLPTTMLAQSAPSPDEAAIRAARGAQNQAIAAGRFDSVASFWVRDVAVVAGLGVTLQGRDRLRAAFAADSGIIYERSPTTVTVGDHWLLGWEEGTWTGHRGSTPGRPLISGRYSAQWIKVKGRWLIRAELFVALACSGQACHWPAAPPSL